MVDIYLIVCSCAPSVARVCDPNLDQQSGNHGRFPSRPGREHQSPHGQHWEDICLTLGVLVPRLLQRLDGWHFIYLHLLQQRTEAQCLIRLPPESELTVQDYFLLACMKQHKPSMSIQPGLSTSTSISTSCSGGLTGRVSTSHSQHSSESQHRE